MKTTSKVFIILGMVLGFLYIVPLVVGFIALDKLEKARKKDDLTVIAICTLLFCSTIAGILMLCMTDKDLNNVGKNTQNNVKTDDQIVEETDKFQLDDKMASVTKNIEKLKELKEQGILSEEEFEKLRKTEVDKLLKE